MNDNDYLDAKIARRALLHTFKQLNEEQRKQILKDAPRECFGLMLATDLVAKHANESFPQIEAEVVVNQDATS